VKTPADSRRYFRGSRDGKRPLQHDPLAGAKARYDVIVIGSGLAGMTAANVLGKLGHKVALLEQHYNFGGMATWFKRRGGHVFDISLHGFPVGMIKTCRRHWTPAIAQRIVRLDSIRFDNPQFSFETQFTREDFVEKLVSVFGQDRAGVERFFTHLRSMNFYDDPGDTVADVFEHFFPGRNDVHRLLLEPIAYANGSTLEDPAITYGIVFSNFMPGSSRSRAGRTSSSRIRTSSPAQGDSRGRSTDPRRAGARSASGARRFLASDRALEARTSTTIRARRPEHFEAFAARRAVRLNNSAARCLGIPPARRSPSATSFSRPAFDRPCGPCEPIFLHY
jgi:hypothetical protein